ncbi:MAG: hypothetical protein QOH60_1409 [Mycobacterium sp.]|jgi:hypothetical protein|nr:hypothetical protein [Mycobacterium sp.]
MKTTIKLLAPWLSAAAIGGAIALAPIASAAPDPLVPYGPDPQIPYHLGFYNPNQSDDSGTTNPAGGIDLPG